LFSGPSPSAPDPRRMSVEFLPRAKIDERILRTAIAGLMVSRKSTPKAAKRCRKRRERAIGALEAGAEDAAEASVVLAAADWLRQSCRACGKCPGVAVMPPRPTEP
jgi:hypothetical protein